MANASIDALLTELRRRYPERLLPYGSANLDDAGGHGMCFRLEGVPATFSVLTLDGSLPFGRFDVQMESYPPGEYVWANEYEFEEFLQIVADVERGVWPG